MMIFFGCISLALDFRSIYTPAMFEMHENLRGVMTQEINEFESDSINNIIEDTDELSQKDMMKQLNNKMDDLFYISDFTKTWLVRFGFSGLFVSIIYILGGVFLLIVKSFSIKLVYTSIGLSILFNFIEAIVLSLDSKGSFVLIWNGISQAFGILIDVILLIVILISSKEAYRMN
ncbi:hypothetical protein ACFS5J_12185 [Flavobacterium chuncheonense]|uniref:Uncharacterized protein n=1 Tax=Flavobacterium chuncheonense TaxID=2026653 RepID=A0ABW5YNX9_9FLAO